MKRKTNEELKLDEDVVTEQNRVKDGKDFKVKVSGFRKIYGGLVSKPTLAVENISFGLNFGECFALLGVNGAGKSTTFKTLTGEYTQSSGEVEIGGMKIKDDFGKICKLIGYCP